MNKLNLYQTSDQTSSAVVAQQSSAELFTFGERQGWHVRVLGKAPMIKEHIHLQDWLMVPAHQDDTTLPPRAMQRVQRLYASGIPIQGLVLVHEAPKLLADPGPEASAKEDLKPSVPTVGSNNSLFSVFASLGSIMAVFGTVFLSMLGMAAGALVLDPILIAVTEDNTWIEIDRWSSVV